MGLRQKVTQSLVCWRVVAETLRSPESHRHKSGPAEDEKGEGFCVLSQQPNFKKKSPQIRQRYLQNLLTLHISTRVESLTDDGD